MPLTTAPRWPLSVELDPRRSGMKRAFQGCRGFYNAAFQVGIALYRRSLLTGAAF
jgi:hypothetical protein